MQQVTYDLTWLPTLWGPIANPQFSYTIISSFPHQYLASSIDLLVDLSLLLPSRLIIYHCHCLSHHMNFFAWIVSFHQGGGFHYQKYSQVNQNDWPQNRHKLQFSGFWFQLIYLSYCNHLIHKKYTDLFGIQLGMLISLICPYSQETDHWDHLQWKLITQWFDCQQELTF
jgi:hypothetical protein